MCLTNDSNQRMMRGKYISKLYSQVPGPGPPAKLILHADISGLATVLLYND